jgi:hypothetical protein
MPVLFLRKAMGEKINGYLLMNQTYRQSLEGSPKQAVNNTSMHERSVFDIDFTTYF